MTEIPTGVILFAANTHRDGAIRSIASAKHCFTQDLINNSQAMELALAAAREARDHIVRAQALAALVPAAAAQLSAELNELLASLANLAATIGASEGPAPKSGAVSPFVRHRALILGYNGTAVALQDLLLNCWGGKTFPVALSKLNRVDAPYRTAAVEMLEHYSRNGEDDKAFMALADEILARRRTEET